MTIAVGLLAIIAFCMLPKPPLLQGIPFSQVVYDDRTQLLRLSLTRDEKYRLFQPLAKISPRLIAATLLQEDQYFYQHPGINPFATLKAIWQTYVVHSRRIGASTITMQLARIRYKLNSKTISGKIKQIIYALELERHYSKQQILEAYLNLVPYGGNIEGAGAASIIYFKTSVAKISLPQALTLAVIPQNPNKRHQGNQQLQDIRDRLYRRWLKVHPQDKEFATSMQLPLAFKSVQSLPLNAPHFTNTLLRSYPGKDELHSTLDLHLQHLIEKISHRYLARKKNVGVQNVAILLVDSRDLAVKAALGSGGFFTANIQGQVNGLRIKRSPGSTLKPFIYALALDQGLIHPASVLKDVPTSFHGYNPENFDSDFMGPIKARDALILSRNIPAIDLAGKLHHPSLFGLLAEAQVRNLKSESYYGLALALGGAEITAEELTSLYAMLANGGMWRPLRALQQQPQVAGKRLISQEASFLVLDMLKDTPRPDGSSLDIKLPVSWKTGTSSGFRDAWTCGIFGPYVLTVWLGNFDNRSNPALVGKSMAAPLFFEILSAIEHENPHLLDRFADPKRLNLHRVLVCKASGLLPTRYCHTTEKTWFIPGKSPIKKDNIYREVAIDKTSGLRTCHYNNNTFFKIYEFWPSDILKIFKQAGIQRQSPPPFTPDCQFSANNNLPPQIISPQTDLQYVVRAHVTSPTLVPLSAIADGGVHKLYWFINERFIGSSTVDKPILWTAVPGHFTVRVVDEHGLADARDVTIVVNG